MTLKEIEESEWADNQLAAANMKLPSRLCCGVEISQSCLPTCYTNNTPRTPESLYSTVPLPDGIVIGGPWPHTIVSWPGGKSRGATKPEYDLFQALEKAHAKIEAMRSKQIRQKAKYLDWLQTNSTMVNREPHQWGVSTENGIAYGETLTDAIKSAMLGDFADDTLSH